MAYARIATFVEGLDANGGTTATSFNSTGADLIVVGVGWNSVFGTTPPTVSDNKSNGNATLIAGSVSAPVGGDGYSALYYWDHPSSVGSSHTFTISATGSYPAIGVRAYSGALASPLDKSDNGTQVYPGSFTDCTLDSVTPTSGQNDELIVTFLCNYIDPDAADRAIDDGFGNLDQVGFVSSPTVHHPGAMADKIKTDGTAEAPTWSWTGNEPTANASIATFKAATVSASSIVAIADRQYRARR